MSVIYGGCDEICDRSMEIDTGRISGPDRFLTISLPSSGIDHLSWYRDRAGAQGGYKPRLPSLTQTMAPSLNAYLRTKTRRV